MIYQHFNFWLDHPTITVCKLVWYDRTFMMHAANISGIMLFFIQNLFATQHICIKIIFSRTVHCIPSLQGDVEPTSVKGRNDRLQVGVGLTTLNQRRISVGKATVGFPFFSRRWARYGITTVGFSVPRQRRVRFDRPTVGFSSFHQRWVNFDKTTVGIRLFADAWFEYLTYDCLYLNSRFKTRI